MIKKRRSSNAPAAVSPQEISDVRQRLETVPGVEETSNLLSLVGNATRLKVLSALEGVELAFGDLAEVVGLSVSALSQHLGKLRAYGLIAPRREAQTVYYRLTDHAFNGKLRILVSKPSGALPPPIVEPGAVALSGPHGPGGDLDE
jgi:DNA-binding transcriptional ArsR family regulator